MPTTVVMWNSSLLIGTPLPLAKVSAVIKVLKIGWSRIYQY